MSFFDNNDKDENDRFSDSYYRESFNRECGILDNDDNNSDIFNYDYNFGSGPAEFNAHSPDWRNEFESLNVPMSDDDDVEFEPTKSLARSPNRPNEFESLNVPKAENDETLARSPNRPNEFELMNVPQDNDSATSQPIVPEASISAKAVPAFRFKSTPRSDLPSTLDPVTAAITVPKTQISPKTSAAGRIQPVPSVRVLYPPVQRFVRIPLARVNARTVNRKDITPTVPSMHQRRQSVAPVRADVDVTPTVPLVYQQSQRVAPVQPPLAHMPLGEADVDVTTVSLDDITPTIPWMYQQRPRVAPVQPLDEVDVDVTTVSLDDITPTFPLMYQPRQHVAPVQPQFAPEYLSHFPPANGPQFAPRPSVPCMPYPINYRMAAPASSSKRTFEQLFNRDDDRAISQRPSLPDGPDSVQRVHPSASHWTPTDHAYVGGPRRIMQQAARQLAQPYRPAGQPMGAGYSSVNGNHVQQSTSRAIYGMQQLQMRPNISRLDQLPSHLSPIPTKSDWLMSNYDGTDFDLKRGKRPAAAKKNTGNGKRRPPKSPTKSANNANGSVI